jgi:Cu(I)/Ag(I) efflux system membrane fusion protein
MKKQCMISIAMIIAISAGAFAQHSGHKQMQQKKEMKTMEMKAEAPVSFRVQLYGAAKAYFELKDALVKSDAKGAAEKAAAFETAFAKINADELPEDLKSSWADHGGELLAASKKVGTETDISKQRAAFYDLSKSLIAAANHYGLLDMSVYVQHCPMAFDNTGGDWLSDSEEILNPYFGKMMLHCGSVTETIGQK